MGKENILGIFVLEPLPGGFAEKIPMLSKMIKANYKTPELLKQII